jgi:hypothetical protein
MVKKITKEKFIKKANNIHNNKYDYIKFDYINSSIKGIIICPEHGEFLQSPNKHINAKQQCPKCSNKHHYTNQEYIEKVNQIHNKFYQYDKTKYISSHNNITITCPKHGDFKLKAYTHLNGQGCPECKKDKIGNALRISVEDRILKFNQIHDNLYDYSLVKKIKNKTDKIDIICKEHGIFSQQVSAHANGQGCPECAKIKSRLSQKDFINRCKNIHNNLYDYSKVDYQGINSKIIIICKEHGKFIQRAGNHLNGNKCPRCNKIKQISSQEIKIRDFLDSIGIQYIANDKQKIFPKELDIFIPEYNLAIEINGIYWHSDKFKDEKYHINKLTDCENAGIQLLQFYDTEIDNKFDIVTSMIKNKLGKTENKIFARRCEIKHVDKQTSKSFQESNHIQGYVPSSIELGLFYNDELVLLTTFGKPRFNKNYEYELLRLCTKQNYSVVGGFSKILKFFKQNYSSSIISYACRKYSVGNVYEKTGFTFIENSKPSYVYTKDNIVLSRYQCQKHKLKNLLGSEFDCNLTEKENMIKAGYHKVFDCGNKVYVL